MRKGLVPFLTAAVLMGVTSSMAMPIPPEVKSVVAFIFVPDEKGQLIANGTAFFMGVKNPEKPEAFAVYFVTAKHVLQKPDRRSLFSAVFLRMNTRDGKAEMIRLPLITGGRGKNVFMHLDATVDLLVIPALPDQSKYDFMFLPDDFVTTRNDFRSLKIREGSEVFFTGLFTPYIGQQRNYPIVRFGRFALVTDEKIPWDQEMAELYLVESASYGGNSGSPVFFYLGAEREPGSLIVGNPILKLAGVMKGSFGERRPIEIVETARVPMSSTNIGIAAVVPAYKLHEILFGAEVKAHRGF